MAWPLVAVPNVSEGRDDGLVGALARAFAGADAHLLDRHSDPTHNRSVLTLAGSQEALTEALIQGVGECVQRLDLRGHEGEHPHVGVVDVCPIVWVSEEERAAAEATALSVAQWIATELEVPVMLYGELASSPERIERAYFRRGGPGALAARMERGEVRPDMGPGAAHPSAGVALVTARPPLAAFNVLLEGADGALAGEVAGSLREAGGGLEGVRAIAIEMPDGRQQISTNVHDPVAVPLGSVVGRIGELAAPRARPVEAELIGLGPEHAFAGYPHTEVPIAGFDEERHVLERRLAALTS